MMYAGLDVHKDFVQVCLVDQQGVVAKEDRCETDSDGLSKLTGLVASASCVIECSTACIRVYDHLTSKGIDTHVANPLKVKAIASAKLKNDKVDARMLAHLLRCNLIPESHIPKVQVRELRDLINKHVSLTRQRTGEINKLRALLLRNNASTQENILTSRGFNKLVDGIESETLKLLLQQSKRQLDFIKSELKIVDEVIVKRAQANEDAVLLNSIPGVGWFSALLIAVHIDGVQRFSGAEKLVSYAGLAPRVRQSGNSPARTGGISKQGNSLLRWILIQNAWQIVRRSPHYKKVFAKMSERRGLNKGIVAIARKLLHVMYFMLVKKQSYIEKTVVTGSGE